MWHSREELTRACAGYSSVLVGSDQLWLPSNIDADYYTLTWVPDGVNKIAYATSFGTNFLPDWLVPRARAFLSRIQYLSVREKSAVEMVRSYARLVCDPTLLFTAEEWMCIQPPEPVVRGDYILCYFLGNNTADRRFACRLREKTGCKIVALLHLNEYIRADEGYADETPFDVGPGELLNLIRNARYIVTDSFHGSVFSILNRKTFFTSRRIRKEGLLCTNNRLDSLFETLGVTGRLITGEEDVEECLARPLDYEPIHRNLAPLRESTSGDAFTPIAEYVLKQGGTVFGAAFVDGQWNVAHVSAATTGELARFRSSKYIQSEIRDTFAQAKKLLDQGQWVCFSGTPCQIGGLKQFLPREYDKLVTVDVECRAVPSPWCSTSAWRCGRKPTPANRSATSASGTRPTAIPIPPFPSTRRPGKNTTGASSRTCSSGSFSRGSATGPAAATASSAANTTAATSPCGTASGRTWCPAPWPLKRGSAGCR